VADAFQRWLLLRQLAVGDLPKQGGCPAVYAFRDARTGDILKFGNTGCLRTRIVGNYLGGYGGKTTERIYNELFDNGMIDRVEIAWIETKDKGEAERKEREFRAAYKKVHGRRPLWDLID